MILILILISSTYYSRKSNIVKITKRRRVLFFCKIMIFKQEFTNILLVVIIADFKPKEQAVISTSSTTFGAPPAVAIVYFFLFFFEDWSIPLQRYSEFGPSMSKYLGARASQNFRNVVNPNTRWLNKGFSFRKLFAKFLSVASPELSSVFVYTAFIKSQSSISMAVPTLPSCASSSPMPIDFFRLADAVGGFFFSAITVRAGGVAFSIHLLPLLLLLPLLPLLLSLLLPLLVLPPLPLLLFFADATLCRVLEALELFAVLSSASKSSTKVNTSHALTKASGVNFWPIPWKVTAYKHFDIKSDI
jgi:hypothetical protein